MGRQRNTLVVDNDESDTGCQGCKEPTKIRSETVHALLFNSIRRSEILVASHIAFVPWWSLSLVDLVLLDTTIARCTLYGSLSFQLEQCQGSIHNDTVITIFK
jgi:hypothetical protein